jgi:NADH-quinone oxidoreductase subunit G
MTDKLDKTKQVTVYIDNVAYQVDQENNLLAGVLSQKLNLPYFCWHPAMGSVGACRQCAVSQYQDENDTRGRTIMACMTPVTDGMRIGLQDQNSVEFREQVVAAMMTNHPHDCPVCSEGGECHLQDMTVMTGHTERHYAGLKRTFNNQYLGELVGHEMNRCITCYRCVRFYKDYAGGKDFDVFGSKNQVYFGRQKDGVLESEFSGNLVEVCPTGVFTNKPFSAHYTRKWDLQSAPSVCAHCAVGCNTSIGERYGSVRRVVNRYNPELNGHFLCDRGRYGIDFVNGEQRINKCGGIKQQSADKLTGLDVAKTLTHFRGKQFIGIGSMRASQEANFYLQQLVGKTYFSGGFTDHNMALVAQHQALLNKYPAPDLMQVEQSDFVLIIGEDISQTSPRLALAVRQTLKNASVAKAATLGLAPWQDDAVRNLSRGLASPIYSMQSVPTKLDDICQQQVLLSPQEIENWLLLLELQLQRTIANKNVQRDSDEDDQVSQAIALSRCQQDFIEPLVNALLSAKKPLIVSGWSSGSAHMLAQINSLMTRLYSEEFQQCRQSISAVSGDLTRLVVMPQQCNSTGLLSLVDEHSLSVEQVFALLEDTGADNQHSEGLNKQIAGVIVLENELAELSDPQVARLRQVAETVIVLDHSQTRLSLNADILMPVAAVSEGEGHYVNYRGQAQRYYQAHAPMLPKQDSWRWLNLLGQTLFNQSKIDSLCKLHQSFIEQYNGWTLTSLIDEQTGGQKVARQTHRASGRTAQMANISVHEAKTTQSESSPLSYSMEGRSLGSSADMPFTWAPGWNSNQSITQYQNTPGGALNQAAETQQLVFLDPLNFIKKYPCDRKTNKTDYQKKSDELVFVQDQAWHQVDWQASFTPQFTLMHQGNRLFVAEQYAKEQGWQQGQYIRINLAQPSLSVLAQVYVDKKIADPFVYGCLFELGVNAGNFVVQLSLPSSDEITSHQATQQAREQQAKVSQDATLERLKQADQYIPIRLVCGGLDDV